MAVFYIGSYDIVDPHEFQKYPPLVMALLPKYGGVVLASDTSGCLVEGTARTMNAIIRFPQRTPRWRCTTMLRMKWPNESGRHPRQTSPVSGGRCRASWWNSTEARSRPNPSGLAESSELTVRFPVTASAAI